MWSANILIPSKRSLSATDNRVLSPEHVSINTWISCRYSQEIQSDNGIQSDPMSDSLTWVSQVRPRSRSTGRFRQDNTGNRWTWKQHSSRIFSDDFLPISVRKHKKLAGIHRKNPHHFRPEYCFHVPAISGVFLPDTVTFAHLSSRIR